MLRRFAKDERGNFAVLTGLMATVLIGALGGALDLSMQWTNQAAVQRAADAAALAGAKALEVGTEADARSMVQAVGHANLPDDFTPVTFNATIDQTAGTVTVDGIGSIDPYFLGLFKIEKLPIGSSAQALIQRKSYIDFYFLLDASESMNIAASDADRTKLENITGNYNNRPCAFACHEVESWAAPISVYAMNELQGPNKAKLRIDVLRSAANSMIDKILGLNSQAGSLKATRIATASFNLDFMFGVGPTTQAALLHSSIAAVNANNHTDMKKALTKFSAKIGTQGDGKTASTPKKFAILVVDGVNDVDFSKSTLGPIDISLCDAIKNKGIDLAVLEIKYIEYRDRYGFFDQHVGWFYNRISPSLKTCASSGLYYQAVDSAQAEQQLMKAVDDLLTVRRRLSS